MAKAYKPSGKVTVYGLVLMILLGGLVAGLGSYAYLSLPWTLVAVFAGILGGLVGLAAGLGVRWGKVRNRILAGAIGLLCGLVAYGLVFFWGYRDLVRLVADELDLEAGSPLARAVTQEFIEEETGQSGLWGYAVLLANSGGETQCIGLDCTSWEVEEASPFENWASWAVDLLVCAAVAAAIPGAFASEPFCEQDKVWCEDRTILTSSLESAKEIHGALFGGELLRLPELVQPVEGKAKTEVKVTYCPRCRSGYVDLNLSGPKKTVTGGAGRINAGQLAALLAVSERIQGTKTGG